MKLIPVDEIREEMVLGKSIYTVNHQLLLGAGYRITNEIIDKLIERGYNHVYIMEEGTENIIPEDIISDEVRHQAQYNLANKAEKVRNIIKFKDLSRERIYDQIRHGALKDVNITHDIKLVGDEILKDISTIGASTLNTLLFKSKNSYHLDHALNTTIIAILIGKKYGLTREDLLYLSVGTFLHDLGKIVLEKMKETSDPNAVEKLDKEHPTFGYLIMNNSKSASPIVCQTIKQHHEHQDGSGYPLGLHGENLPPINPIQRKRKGMIYRLAEICTVADAYDNLVMNPLEEKQLTPSEAIKEIIYGAETLYNKHIVTTLTTIIPYYPIGTTVKIKKLVDTSLIGYTGIVAKIYQDNLNKPVILLTEDKLKRKIKPPRLIDTSKLSYIDLELIL